MRKYVRTRILEILATVLESMKTARNLQPQIAEGVLSDCLAALRAVGNTLQNLLSAETALSYMEILTKAENLLDELYACLLQGQDTAEAAKKIKLLLRQMEKKLAAEPEIHLEIAFMPYKASMWDALESIWESARQDPRCETYVVPLPFYERKPDLQLGAFHYEGSQFPDNVPITHYEDYPLDVRMPDIIYIHCPYDDRNYATSVAPRFYSTELKKYTDMLVYVPYFVSGQTVTEAFCRLPGVYQADRVIVQSEEIRKQYSKYSGLPLSRFLPLGSPKFDKVRNAKREDFTIPPEWKAQIGNKKVVLYNTSLGNITKDSHQFIEKLNDVFSCFADRTDVILWWRPHPLSRSTASSMQPGFYPRYCAAEERFQQNSLGIFDNTPDLHRAFAFSDAYYGDASSLVPMYELTGKPMLLTAVSIRSGNSQHFQFTDCAVVGDLLYFSESSFNGLFQKNLRTGEILFLGEFPGEEKNGRELYNRVAPLGDRLFFLPALAREIAVYDTVKQTFSKIAMPAVPAIFPGTKFFSYAVWNQDIFMIGCYWPAIFRLDTQSLEITVYTDWFTKNRKTFTANGPDYLFGYNAAVADHYFYAASSCCNAVLEFDMNTGKSRLIGVGSKDNRYGGICRDGGNFWLSPRQNGPLLCWNRRKNTVVEYTWPEAASNQAMFTVSMAETADRIFFYYFWDPLLLVLDKKTKQLTVRDTGSISRFLFARQEGSQIYALAAADGKSELFVFDTQTEAVRRFSVEMPDAWNARAEESDRQAICEQLSGPAKPVFHELYKSRLNVFLDALVTPPGAVKTVPFTDTCDGKCGERIHQTIKNTAFINEPSAYKKSQIV